MKLLSEYVCVYIMASGSFKIKNYIRVSQIGNDLMSDSKAIVHGCNHIPK